MKRLLPLAITIFLLSAGPALAADITFAWDPSDGATGYNLYRGTSSRNYITQINVGNVLVYTITGLADGIHYFAATAYDSGRLESDYSDEICVQIRNSWIPSLRSCTLSAPSFRIKEGTIVFTPKE